MRKKFWKSQIAGILIASLLTSNAGYAGTWHQEMGNWIYQEDGTRITGWMRETGNNWYHFTSEGIMQTGWYQDERKDYYYLNKATDGTEGLMRTGWFLENGKWYFLNTVHDGFYGRAIAGHWQWIDGYCYLFDDNGVMYANCITPDGYTVNQDGKWTVNGIVQYQKGKGILTNTVVDDVRKSRSSSSSDNKPSEGENKPSEGEDKPSEGEDKPSEGEDKPSEGEDKPSEGEDKPSEGEDKPSEGEDKPSEGEDKPSEGEDKPSEGEDKPSEGEDKPSEGEDKPSEGEDKPSEGEDKPSEGEDKPSEEDSGNITLQYMVQETGEILYEKKLSDKIGELCAIQYPAIDGYKILPNQETSARFKAESQVIPIYYRPAKDGESPDESIVLQDNVKGILSDSVSEQKIVEQIASDFFDINLDDEDNLDWAVYNTNPLYDYIQDGTVEPGDILYIAPCDKFPIGFVFNYEGHDDVYTGTYANYDANSYEVLHGKKSSIFEMMGPGTSFSINTDAGNTSVEPAFSWCPWEEEEIVVEHGAERMANSMQGFALDVGEESAINVSFGFHRIWDEKDLSSNKKQTENKDATQSGSGSNTSDKNEDNTQSGNGGNTSNKDEDEKMFQFQVETSIEGEAYAEMNVNIHIPLSEEPEVYISFVPGFKTTASLKLSGEGDLGEKLRELLSKKFLKAIPKETKLSLAFLETNVQGVDLSEHLILYYYAWNIITNTPEINIHNIVKDEFFALDIKNAIFFIVPVTMNLSSVIEGSIAANAEIDFEFPISYKNTREKPLKLGPAKGDITAGADATISGNLDMGLGAGAGLALAGIIPVYIDMRLMGVDVEGKAEGHMNLLPKRDFKGTAEIEGSLYSKIEGMLRFKVYKDEKKGPHFEVKETFAPTIGDMKKGKIEWCSFSFHLPEAPQPATLKLDKNTVLKAVDEKGNDISSQFAGYDEKSKKVKVISNETGGYSFECPRYYMKDDDSTIYEIDAIVLNIDRGTEFNLDLNKVKGLKTLIIPKGRVHLDLSNNDKLETICTESESLALNICPNNCENAYPIPSDFEDEIYGKGDSGILIGNHDFSGLTNLQTFWVQVDGMDKIDLSKNSKLKNVSIATKGSNTKKVDLSLPSTNNIKSFRVTTRMGEKLSKPVDLTKFTHLECALIEYSPDQSETSIDLSQCTKLKHLWVGMKYLTSIDLSHNTALECLNLGACTIEKLDISKNPALKELAWIDSMHVFTGNGEVFPTVPNGQRYAWYGDKCLKDVITDNLCDRGQTIYRTGYKTEDSCTATSRKATSSNAQKATASNATPLVRDTKDEEED